MKKLSFIVSFCTIAVPSVFSQVLQPPYFYGPEVAAEPVNLPASGVTAPLSERETGGAEKNRSFSIKNIADLCRFNVLNLQGSDILITHTHTHTHTHSFANSRAGTY